MSTPAIPQIYQTRGTAPILQDPRLDVLLRQVALSWTEANRQLIPERIADTPELGHLHPETVRLNLRYAAELHCKRALKALRADRQMPTKTTGRQYNEGLRDQDLPQLNQMIRETIGQHVLLLAGAMGECAVLFSDPEQVAQAIDL